MTLVICDMSISLDGYVTGPNDSRENPFGDGAGMLHDWMFGAAATDEDRALLQEMLGGLGAVVMGRKSFEKNAGDDNWGDAGPAATPRASSSRTTSRPRRTRRCSPSSPTASPARSSRPSTSQAARSSACTARLSYGRHYLSAWSTRSACTSSRPARCRHAAIRHARLAGHARTHPGGHHPGSDAHRLPRDREPNRGDDRAMTTTAQFPAAIRRSRFDGEVLTPGTRGYDSARSVWNAMVDHRPALIARCASVGDVVTAVRAAREHDLEIGVRCGGHNVAGLAVPHGGLMIDLTMMGGVSVDPVTRRARVQGGALLGALDRAAQPFGLATTAGNVSHLVSAG